MHLQFLWTNCLHVCLSVSASISIHLYPSSLRPPPLSLFLSLPPSLPDNLFFCLPCSSSFNTFFYHSQPQPPPKKMLWACRPTYPGLSPLPQLPLCPSLTPPPPPPPFISRRDRCERVSPGCVPSVREGVMSGQESHK